MTLTQLSAPLPAFMGCMSLGAVGGVVFDQFRRRETVHAYLLTGARGLGKRTFAKALVCALFCASENRPCGICEQCRSVLNGNNPDVITVFADDGKQIGVDRVREILKAVSQHAFGGGYRVVLIEPVEKMTPQAQNCLLKSLEEPVANVIFLLMTHELTATLGTITSRCVRVKLTPWTDEALQNTLARAGHSAMEFERVLPRCGGNIGVALEILEDEKGTGAAQAFAKEALRMTSDAAAVGLSTRLKDGKENAETSLNALEQAIYQALLVRTGRLAASALADYPPVWRQAAQSADIEDFNRLLGAVLEARRFRAGQVNWQSNLDHLMMILLEEQTKWQQLLA